MSNIQTGAERMPHDLSHLGFLAGQIGRLITISTTPVIAGDSFEMDAVGALARVASIMENTNLSKQQQVSEIMRQMLTQAQTAGQYFTNDQIKEMTRKVSAEVDLVHQQTQNQRYGSSHIGATAKDISN